MIGLYEKLCIMIGMVNNNNKKIWWVLKKCIMIGMVKNNNNNKYMMGLFKLFKLYSSDSWVLFNLDPGMSFWIKTRFEYWILLRTKCIRNWDL
jgi:hypothetical protein